MIEGLSVLTLATLLAKSCLLLLCGTVESVAKKSLSRTLLAAPSVSVAVKPIQPAVSTHRLLFVVV